MPNIFREAFVATIARYKLQVNWLSEESGVSPATITRFKTGARDIYLGSFAEIFEAMPLDSKQFFLEKILGDAIASRISLCKSVEMLDPSNPKDRKQAADAMRLIVGKFLQEEKLSENTEEKVLVVK